MCIIYISTIYWYDTIQNKIAALKNNNLVSLKSQWLSQICKTVIEMAGVSE